MFSLLHHRVKQLAQPVGPALQIQPAEQGFQRRGGMVLPHAGPLGDGGGVAVAAPAVDALLLLGEDGQDGVNQPIFRMVSSMAESSFRILLSTRFSAAQTSGLPRRVELLSTEIFTSGKYSLRNRMVSSMISEN